MPHEESFQLFCIKNKVPYNIFQKWFKDTCKKVVEVYFGDRCQKINSKGKKSASDRQKEKDDYDVTDVTLCTESDLIVSCDEAWYKVCKYDHYKMLYLGIATRLRKQLFFYENSSYGREVLTDFAGVMRN